MNVYEFDPVIFALNNDLFARNTDFLITFVDACWITGRRNVKATVTYLKDAFIRYTSATDDEPSKLEVGEIRKPFGTIQYRVLKTYTRKLQIALFESCFVQGQIKEINSEGQHRSQIEVDQISLIQTNNRYINLGSDLDRGGDIYYKNVLQHSEVHIGANYFSNIELNFVPNETHTLFRPDIEFKLDMTYFGFAHGELSKSIPYSYSKGKMTIPSCFLFADAEDIRPVSLSLKLRQGQETKYYCYIDNRQVLIKDGFTIKDELNETLDSGLFEFVSIGGELPLEPFDNIYFDSEDVPNFEPKRQLLDTYFGEIYNFNSQLSNSDYKYQVSIFSETKMLERVTLPSLSIKKRAIGTQQTVWEKVKEYCRRYLPYIRVYDTAYTSKLIPCFKYDSELEEKLNMACPEFVWNTPTLREVLNDLFSVADLLPIIKNNILTYIDLSAKGKAIDETHLTNRQVSGTSADYCDNITLPMKNILSKKPVVKQERISFRSNSGEINTQNALLQVSKPIYNVRKLIMYRLFDGNGIKRIVKVDVTDLIVEKSEYEALELPNTAQWFTTDKETLRKIRPSHAYYTRGGTEINSILEPNHSLFVDFYTIGLMGLYTDDAEILALTPTQIYNGFTTKNLYTFFEVEYETIEETTINVSKTKPIKNMQNSLFDSQSANSVDLDHQSIFEYAKINRLANKIETIYGEYFDEADIPQLSDYLGDKILFSREITYYDDIIYFKGQIVDNYILKDYFTGVASKRRSWNIADTSEAINRDDYYKIYIAFDESRYVEDETGDYFMSLEDFDYDSFINYLAVGSNRFNKSFATTENVDGNIYPTEVEIGGALEVLTLETSYSIMITTRFPDNKRFGDRAYIDNSLFISTPVKYVDYNGEFVKLTQNYLDYLDEGDGTYDFDTVLEELQTTFDQTKFSWLVSQANLRPLIEDNALKDYEMKLTVNFQKDNGEIIGTNLHFEYISNSPRIIVGKNFCKCVPAGSHEIASSDIGVRITYNHNYKIGDTQVASEGEEVTNPMTISTYLIRNNEFFDNDNNCWCIYRKSTNEILLAVNGIKTIYANMLYVRDTNIYNDQIHKEKIGNVFDESEDIEENYNNSSKYISEFSVYGRKIYVENTKDFNSNE